MSAQRIERLLALIQKEWAQVFRDPSALLVAFALPIVMLFIFGFGLSMDAKDVKVGIVLEDRSPISYAFWRSFDATNYFKATFYDNKTMAEQSLIDGKNQAVLVVPNDFSKQVANRAIPKVQLLVDGTEANLATIVESYALGAFANFEKELPEMGIDRSPIKNVNLEMVMRYNETRSTRNGLTPGSVVLVLAMIGTLLTTMVVAREWERGTMEATLATSVGKSEMILGKLIPYFALGFGAAILCALISRFVFRVPFRCSPSSYCAISSVFLLAATSQGLLISTVCRNQTLASQIALISSFLPNMIFSGVLFEIDAMPTPLQLLSHCFPARYFASSLQTAFMVGDAWELLLRNSIPVALIAAVFLGITIVKTPRTLE